VLDHAGSMPVEKREGDSMRTVGRLLRALRMACGINLEDAAIAAEVTTLRLRQLEAGAASLEYLEGIRLAKSYLLCPTCFKRHFEGALERAAIDE
jgi:DNA-binding XRE family transcriptional regulator